MEFNLCSLIWPLCKDDLIAAVGGARCYRSHSHSRGCTPLMAAYWVCSPCLLHERTRSLSCCCPGMLTHYTIRGCAHPVCGMSVLAHCCAAWCCCLGVLTHWMVRVCSPCLPHEHASSAQCSLGVLTPG